MSSRPFRVQVQWLPLTVVGVVVIGVSLLAAGVRSESNARWTSLMGTFRNASAPVDLQAFPGELCMRSCEDTLPRVCYFNWVLEHYHSMGPACKRCAEGVHRDCYRYGCLTADGFERGVMSINRQIPGPAIQVCKDDLIVVDMTNAMGGTATTMHWHGLHQRETPHMDGVPFVTQCPVEFMSTFRYAFWATEPGTQFYHSHAGHHKVNGHYGAMIIREPEANDPNADLYDFDLPEHLIVASDWMHVDGEMYMPGLPNGDGILPVNVLINGRGTWQKDADSNRTDVPREVYRVRKGGRYRFRFINAASHVCPLELQIANHTLEIIASDSYNLQPITVNTLVATSGERYDFVVSADQPSDDYWIRVRAIGPCDYRKISQGAVLSYRPMSVPVDDIAFPYQGLPDFHEPLFPEVHSVNHPNTTCGVSQPDVCITDFEAYETEDGIINGTPDRQFILGFENYPMRFEDAFGVGQHEHFMNIHDDIVLQGAINNISFTYPPFSLLTQPELITEDMFCDEDSWPERCQSSDHCTCIHRLKIPLNALIELYILDLTPEVNDLNHPFHLHGYQMYVMEMGQDRQKPITMERAQQIALRQSMQRIRMTTMPPKKDTVSVPSKGYTRVRFLADNPGFWLMHCHYEWHTAVGMVLVLQVGEPDSFVQPPSGFPTCNKYTPDVDASLFV
nr:laccase-2-like [Aedes albopictus]